MFKLCQILLVLLSAGGIVIYFGKRRRCGARIVLALVGLLVVSGLISNAILNCIPFPTDEVIVTASGEKTPQALLNEVWLKGYLIGEKEYPLQPPSEGKWFWQGDKYIWRDENDSRQPEGTTRSITLEIPYGKDRSVVFYTSEWEGIAEVTYHGVSQRYDLFESDGWKSITAPIENTETIALYTTKLLRLCIFAIFVLILMAYPCYAVNKFGSERIKYFFAAHWSRFAYIALAIGCFIVMVCDSGTLSFWVDEIWTLGWIYLGYPGITPINIWLNDLWYFLMPYGQEYLLLLQEFFVAAAVYIAGITGELYQGKRFGVIMAALTASSFQVLVQCGSEFRPYAFLVFSAFGLLYFFIKKQKTEVKERTVMIAYVVFLFLTMDTHPFGFVFAGLLMIFDFLLIVLKKVRAAGLIEFVVPVLYAICWIFTLNVNTMSGYGLGWAGMPSIRGVISCIKNLCNDSNILFSLLIIGVAITIVHLLDRSSWKEAAFWESYGLLTLLLVPVLLIALIFLYSFIFKGASVFVLRYFTVLIPEVVFFSAIALNTLFELLMKNTELKQKGFASCILSCVLILCTLSWSTSLSIYGFGAEDYRGSAEFLMSQADIYAPSTICLFYGNEYCNAGFDYYLTQKGKRDPINHVSVSAGNPDNLYEYETIYCFYYHSWEPDPTPFLENGYVEEYNNGVLALKKYVKRSG